MTSFTYTAVDGNGIEIGGSVDSPDKKNAVAALAKQGRFVIDISEIITSEHSGQKKTLTINLLGGGKVSNKDVATMTAQLGTALSSGLPLLNALEILHNGHHKKSVRDILAQLCESVRSGSSLSQAMEKHDEIFSPLYISMVRVGETGGILQQTVSQLAKLLDRDEKVKSSMKTAAAYPLFVLVLGVVSSFVVIRFILPKMLESITGGVSILPWPTKLLMGVSEFFGSYGWIVFLLVIFVATGFLKWKKSPVGRIGWDGFKLKVPVLGSVIKSIAVGRFTRTLGALTKSGITILEALKVVRDTLGNEVLAKEIDKVCERVCAGDSLAEPLGQSGMFPPLLVQIVSIGEHTGKLDELLLNAADTFDAQADAAINRFMAVLPAVLILLLGLVIAFIIAGALLPIIAMDMGGITV